MYHLSDIAAAGIGMVQFACDRCGRAGAYRLTTLQERFGADVALGVVFAGLAADCPRRIDPPFNIQDRCDIRCPTLLRVAGLR